jgi:hypothetical protein
MSGDIPSPLTCREKAGPALTPKIMNCKHIFQIHLTVNSPGLERISGDIIQRIIQLFCYGSTKRKFSITFQLKCATLQYCCAVNCKTLL